MSTSLTQIGVLGCGYWGPNLIRNFNQAPASRTAAVCDLSQARLDFIAHQYPGLHTTRDHRELLADPSVDAIALATPVETHFALGREALLAGKHLLVEKPLARSSRECQELIDLAERQKRVLMVDHTYIYSSAVRKIKELVDRSDLGELYYIDSVRINLGLFQEHVNVIWDLAPHDLSILQYLLGRMPESVSAIAATHTDHSQEHIAYLTLHYPDKLIAHIHVNWLAPVKIRRMLFGGSRKMVVYDDVEPSEKVKVYDRGVTVSQSPEDVHKTLIQYRTGDISVPKLDGTEALRFECEHFIDCIRRQGRPTSDGASGLAVVRVLEAAEASARRQGAPVSCG